MILISDLLDELSEERPVFYTEADFQHALAWKAQSIYPNANIRLEYPVMIDNKISYIDVVIEKENIKYFLELKYKTLNLSKVIDGEQFLLKNQGAQDTGRYDYIKDICRIEKVVKGSGKSMGVALLLTNDASYWTESMNTRANDARFRLHQGRKLNGVVGWSEKAASGTTKGRRANLILEHEYEIRWEGYSVIDHPKNNVFRYLLLQVPPSERS